MSSICYPGLSAAQDHLGNVETFPCSFCVRRSFTLIKLRIRYVLALHSRKIYLLTGRHIFSIPNGGSLPRRHPLGSSRNLHRKGRLHDEPKECLRRRLEPIRMGSNMVARKQQKHLVLSLSLVLLQKRAFIFQGTQEH